MTDIGRGCIVQHRRDGRVFIVKFVDQLNKRAHVKIRLCTGNIPLEDLEHDHDDCIQ